MFDIGWAEFLIIGVVGLVVIGPKDLPEVFRTIGRFTAKLRSMSRDFQRAMETAAKESGVSDVAKDLKTMTSAKNLGLDAVKDAATKFEKWDPLKPKTASTPKPATPVMASPAPETIAAPPAPARPMGPATQALADKVAAKKAIVKEAAEKLRAVSAAPSISSPAIASLEAAAVADGVAKRPGRVRSATKAKPSAPPPVVKSAAKPKPAGKTTAEPAAKPAPKPRAKTPKGDA
jgi:sec-independent protein translocase protein TatB